MALARAVVLEEVGRLAIREFALPTLGDDDGLLRVELAGVCGSDPKIYHGGIWHELPLIMGHEIVGEIAACGPALAAAEGLAPGDRVVVEGIRCGRCRECQRGNHKYCQQHLGYGTQIPSSRPPHLWGAYGQYLYLAPGSIVRKLPAHVSVEEALMIGPLANGIEWVRTQGRAAIGDTVLIQGAGPQGLAAVVAARESGAAQIVCTGLARDAERLALARELGATHTVDVEAEDLAALVMALTDGAGADVVLDVSGSPQAIAGTVELVRRQGTVVIAGLAGAATRVPFATDRLALREIRLQGVFTKGSDALDAAAKLVQAHRYPIERAVTHRFPLSAAHDALGSVCGELPGVYPIKAALDPWLDAG